MLYSENCFDFLHDSTDSSWPPHSPWPPNSPQPLHWAPHSATSLLLISYVLFPNAKDFFSLCLLIPQLCLPRKEKEYIQLWGWGRKKTKVKTCHTWVTCLLKKKFFVALPSKRTVGFGVPVEQLPSPYLGSHFNPWKFPNNWHVSYNGQEKRGGGCF